MQRKEITAEESVRRFCFAVGELSSGESELDGVAKG